MKNHKSGTNGGLVTCVRLSRETRNRLAQLGSKDQTFDDIVNETIDENLENKKFSENELENVMVSDESEEESS
jgi:predicted DNA-binding protein